jgi:RimJ/RimL family protein N-acetyltransferase
VPGAPRVRRAGARLTRVDPIVGERVTLRLFREDELDLWWDASRSFGPDAFPAGPPPKPMLLTRIRRGGAMATGEIDLAVEVNGRVIGDVQTQRPHPLPAGVHQVGIGLFDPADRGRGYGREALQLFTGWLFREHRAERVQAGTAPSNTAMRTVFERLGFTEREPIDVSGQRHLLYAIDRPEWEGRTA